MLKICELNLIAKLVEDSLIQTLMQTCSCIANNTAQAVKLPLLSPPLINKAFTVLNSCNYTFGTSKKPVRFQ